MKETRILQCAELLSALDRNVSPDQILNPETLLATCGGDAVLLRQLVRSFETHISPLLDRLGETIRKQDRVATQYAAHRLKGLVSSFSVNIAEVAQRMDESNYAFDDLAKLHDAVVRMVDQLLVRLPSLSIDDLKVAARKQSQIQSSLLRE